ncbi:hypothetical protein O181_128115 [Austropuccinia psidii MF-1]|uniref:Uncharacterized protein n=1 Tax=Austropuccinia psidii MF-1 TaxID=1389203 RepID=A0A9Q3KZL9_9BASI|nr:hypothetical protein [Austropuccinia psidii MF-1]
MGPLGPFFPKSRQAVHQPPNYKWAHLSQFWPQNPTNPELAKTTLGPKIGHNSVHSLWKLPEATSSAPSKDSPQVQGKTFPSSRIQEWCKYGIIYHYAPFFLSNTMVMFSGPNYVIHNQVPNPSPISKEDFSAIPSGNSLVATRRPFEDPNHLALQELGCQLSSELF